MKAQNAGIPLDDRRVVLLLAEVRRIQEGEEKRGPRETLEAYQALLFRAEAAGLRSIELLYCAAEAAHHLGDLAGSLDYLLQAVALDPISPMLRRALDQQAGKAEAALAAKDRDPDDPSTPRLHALLVRAGKATPRCHVALARHLAEAGDAEGARALLDAVTRLAPRSREAWALRGELALAAGDTALAQRCAIECAAAAVEEGGGAALPFLSAGVAQA